MALYLTVRQRMLPVITRLRGMNADEMGLRPFTAYVRQVTSSDSRGGVGATLTRVDTPLVERVRVRPANATDVARSGGVTAIADWILSRSTPRNELDTVGTMLSNLLFSPSLPRDGKMAFLVLDGPGFAPYVGGATPSGGQEFTVIKVDVSRDYEWTAVLRPRT